jgi:MFS family permease
MNEETGYKWTKTDVGATTAAIIAMIIGFLVSYYIAKSVPEEPPGWPWPGEWGPPPIMVWMPAIISSIPLIICIGMMATANRRARAKSQQPAVYRYRDETLVYTGDYKIDSKSELKEPEKIYLIPDHCPTCNSSLNADVVDWVGPLKAKCPYCETIIDVKEKIF